ncbi:MAG: 2-oxoacid:acceptor oxidoreductase family protein [Desulfovibrio sp.]|jgi:indolepyruvate ferredoxin oxidoreductase beta subunit|nr:2-oxoacid:acceptor oxidoreductase family protein [Desulfovibrio sp.]
METRLRIYLTGVGGQGSLTATTLFARLALDQDLAVVSGEVHGMAQRGGVVESAILLGGWQSPTLSPGEADILLGFEPLETLRGLPFLKAGGAVFSSTDFLPPSSVSAGKASLPSLSSIQEAVRAIAARAWFLPIRGIGAAAGSSQSGNAAMLGALCASGLLPFGLEALTSAIRAYLPAKLVPANLAAAAKGAEWPESR